MTGAIDTRKHGVGILSDNGNRLKRELGGNRCHQASKTKKGTSSFLGVFRKKLIFPTLWPPEE